MSLSGLFQMVKWVTWRRTEPKGYPIPHRMLVLYPLTMDELRSFWAEVVSWNPAGHFSKITAGRFVLKDTEMYSANVLYSGTKFKKQLISTARYIAGRRIKWFSGDFRMQFRMDDDFRGKIPKLRPSWQGMPRNTWKSQRKTIREKQKSVSYPAVGTDRRKKIEQLSDFIHIYLM